MDRAKVMAQHFVGREWSCAAKKVANNRNHFFNINFILLFSQNSKKKCLKRHSTFLWENASSGQSYKCSTIGNYD